MRTPQTILWIAIVACVGCASNGFNRGELRKQIGVINPVTEDADIAKTLKKRANLPRPFKLAVYFRNPIQNRSAYTNWRWSEEDRRSMIQTIEKLNGEKVISQVFPIISSMVQEESIKSIRMAAAKHGADSVLILSGVAEVDRYINNWGLTYILLAPVFFVPGSDSETLFLANASMWDVRNEFLYITAEAEGTYDKTDVAVFSTNDKSLIEEAKKKALGKLSKQIVKMIKGR